MKLDLGSGAKPMEGFLGVDGVPGITDFSVDLWRDGEEPNEEQLALLRRRARTEWNVAEESLMQLVAEKGDP